MVRWLLILVFVVIGWFVVSTLASILAPILVALGIAYLLDPVLERMVARGISRTLAATVLLFAFLGLLIGALVILIPQAIDQITSFVSGLDDNFRSLSVWIQEKTGVDLESYLDTEALKSLLEKVAGPLEHVAEAAVGGVFTVLALLAEMLLIPVFAYYFLLDWKHIEDRIMKLVPPRRRGKVLDILGEIDGVVSGWVRGQAIVTSLLAVLYAVAFWVIGVPLAIPIGLLVGALTIIPFVGTFVGAGVTAVVLALDWQGSGVAIGVGGTFVVLHVLEAAVLTPKITGHKVGLSESAALFAVVAGGKLLGFVGVLLAVPLAATIAVLLRHVVRYYERTEFFGEESDALVSVSPAMALVMTDEKATGTVREPGAPAAAEPDRPAEPDQPDPPDEPAGEDEEAGDRGAGGGDDHDRE